MESKNRNQLASQGRCQHRRGSQEQGVGDMTAWDLVRTQWGQPGTDSWAPWEPPGPVCISQRNNPREKVWQEKSERLGSSMALQCPQ